MIRTFTSLIFGIKRHCLSAVNIKLISCKYSLISNKISSQIRLPTMQQHGRNRQQPGDNRQHHGGNQQQHGGNRGNQKEEFVFFFGPKFTFSQMHPARFTVDGREFCCMEQYMQYEKAMTFGDSKTAKLIMSTHDPKEHKKLGRKVSPFDPKQWGWKSVAVVRKGNLQKYLQNPSMKRELFATHPKTLVEASPRDRLWGIGLGKENPKARDRSQWRGKNLLGQILTEVRDYLMAREGGISSQSSAIEKGHEAKREEFVFFFGPMFTFSQMHPANFTVDYIKFCCMEQYMQYQKAVTFDDRNTAKLIMSTQDPKEHKKLGRKVSPFDPKTWEWKSVAVVRKGNIQKYLQNPSMKRELFDTYPKTLVEASPRDRLWGIGLTKDNPKAGDRSQWRGKNLLGQTLTEVRDYLMAREGGISSQSSSIEERQGNSSPAKFKHFNNPKAEFPKTDYDKHCYNKKDRKSEEHKHSSPYRFGTNKSGRKDEEMPSRSKVRDETTLKKERSGDRKSSSLKKRKREDGEDSCPSDEKHQSNEKSPSSKKRKREDGEDSCRSDERYQSDEKSSSSKKRKREDGEDSCHSDERYQYDEKSSSSKKRKREDGKDSCRSDERYQYDEKSSSSKKRKHEDGEDSCRSNEKQGKSSSENNENVTNKKDGKSKQKKITVRLPETERSDKDGRSNKDAVETCKSDALKLIGDYGIEDTTQLEMGLEQMLPAEETKSDDPDTSQESKDIKL